MSTKSTAKNFTYKAQYTWNDINRDLVFQTGEQAGAAILTSGSTHIDGLVIQPGAPILIGDEVTYDVYGAVILAGTMSYRADAYRFEADLYRPA